MLSRTSTAPAVNFPCYAFTGFISLAMSSSRILQQSDAAISLRADVHRRRTCSTGWSRRSLWPAGHMRRLRSGRRTRAHTIGTIPAGTVADLELAVERARAAQAAWSRRTFCRPRAHLPALSRSAAGAPGRSAGSHPMGNRQGAAARIRRDSGHRDRHALLRAAGGAIAAAAAAQRRASPADPDPGTQIAGGRGRLDRPVELSAQPGGDRRGAGADGGQRRGAQTGCANQFHGALGGGPAAPGRPSAGRIQRGHGRRTAARGRRWWSARIT